MGWEADAVQRQYDIARSSIPTGGGRGMDPIIGSSLIGAGSSIASSVTGGKAAKEAAKAQAAAQDKALAFAREQEATRQAQYGQAFQMWYASQNALRERYGLPPLPPMTAFPAGGGAAPEPTLPGGGVKPGVGGAPPPEPTLTASAGAVAPATIREIMDRGSLDQWNNWRQFA